MHSNPLPVYSGWSEVMVGSVATVEVGGTPSTLIQSYWNGDIPWMSSGDVHQKRIFDVPGRITALGLASSNAKLVSPPSVAIALAGQGKTRGTAALVLTELCTNQSVALIKGAPNVLDTVFLFHLLDSRYEELRASSAGGGRAGLSKAILENVLFQIPPLNEQRAIAAILDSADAAIQSADALIAKLRLERDGLLHDLLTRGVDESGVLRDPDAHPEQFKDSELGRIPAGWEIKTLKTLATVGYGIALGRDLRGVQTIELPYLRVANVQDGYLDLTEIKTLQLLPEEVSEYLLEVGDVLIAEGGDYDKVGRGTVWQGQITPCVHQNHIFRVRFHADTVLPEYFAFASRSQYGKRYFLHSSKQSTNLASINSTQLKAFPLPCPSWQEQQWIVSYIEAVNRRIGTEEQRRDKLRAIKAGLMDDLLTGRVRVADVEGWSLDREA